MFQNILLTISQQVLSTGDSNIHTHRDKNIKTHTSWSLLFQKFWDYVFQSQQHPHGQNIYSVIHTFHSMWLSGPISSYTCWLVSYSGLGSRLSVNPNIRRFHHISKIKLLLLFTPYESCQALMLILRPIFSSYYIYFNTNNQKCVLKLEEHMQSKTNTVYNYCGCIVYYWIHLTIMEDKIWTYW